MEVGYYNAEGVKNGTVTLEDFIFAVEPNQNAIYLDVRLFLANQRQGTHKTKERGEISGTTRKPYRQKGTGNARQGHMRAPHHRHGGTVFGPRPRDYGYKLNKKFRRLARRSALSLKVTNNRVMVIDDLNFEKPSTKRFLEIAEKMQLTGKKTLWLTNGVSDAVFASGRNIPKTRVAPAQELNTYDVMNAEHVVIFKSGLDTLRKNLSSVE